MQIPTTIFSSVTVIQKHDGKNSAGYKITMMILNNGGASEDCRASHTNESKFRFEHEGKDRNDSSQPAITPSNIQPIHCTILSTSGNALLMS